jgi:hypothetical protein
MNDPFGVAKWCMRQAPQDRLYGGIEEAGGARACGRT